MSEWKWITRQVIEAVHDLQIAEHGGGAGLRDPNMLESALARPVNLTNCGDPDAARLAAAVAIGLARSHPFVDGNKRSAWVAARLFLRLDGQNLSFDKAEATVMMRRLAAGELDEDAVATWFRERLD